MDRFGTLAGERLTAALLLQRFFPQLHRAAAALALALFAAADRADVAPVIDLVRHAPAQTVYFQHLQELAAGQQPAGQAHRPMQQRLVLEEHTRTAVLDERIDLAVGGHQRQTVRYGVDLELRANP